jgi:L-threonylcarbamoyladenylate synthase
MAQPRSQRIDSEVKGTKIIRVDPSRPEIESIRKAADIIRKGGTVAFPTETVYGLGADALNPQAVIEIFKAKKRPPDNPIIVHISSTDWVERLAKEVPEKAWILNARFWPGPLTMVLKASDIVSRATTGGLDTVAVRMPSHRVASALIRESGVPIAAPSANLAGRPSPTTAEHVINDLAGRIDLILDAGPTNVGVESTVVDLTRDPPMILRPGGITYEELRNILGSLSLHPSVQARIEPYIERALSPGMKYRHYAPKAELILIEGEPDAMVGKIREMAEKYSSNGKKVGILAFDESRNEYDGATVKSMGSRIDLKTAAKRLFSLLRELDEEGIDVILAEGMPEKGLGLAVMNRLIKASGYSIIEVHTSK